MKNKPDLTDFPDVPIHYATEVAVNGAEPGTATVEAACGPVTLRHNESEYTMNRDYATCPGCRAALRSLPVGA